MTVVFFLLLLFLHFCSNFRLPFDAADGDGMRRVNASKWDGMCVVVLVFYSMKMDRIKSECVVVSLALVRIPLLTIFTFNYAKFFRN